MSDFGKGINVTSKDIVYRQDVEDMLRNALPSRGMWEIEGDVVKNTICETVVDLMMDLEKMPSAQPEQQWIPCSERLPEIGQSVLLSVGGMYSAEGCLREDGDWAQFRWDAIQRKDMVGAWKPLPEPYKGEQE